MKRHKYNDHIAFRLDGKREGEGYVKNVYGDEYITYDVELTAECKEWHPGTRILVTQDEVMDKKDYTDYNYRKMKNY